VRPSGRSDGCTGLQEKQYRVDQLIGESESTRALRDLHRQTRSGARPDDPGPTARAARAKELVACGLHYESARRDFPFMEVNCAAITETLFESELFAHEKGAFTDAKSAKRVLMELRGPRHACCSTRCARCRSTMQAKFLVLQERVVRRVGGTRDIRVDVGSSQPPNRPSRRA